MKFPDKYIERGEFTLHSGKKSNLLYDVNALLTDENYKRILLDKIPRSDHYVGIATGGAIIAAMVSLERKAKFSMVLPGMFSSIIRLDKASSLTMALYCSREDSKLASEPHSLS